MIRIGISVVLFWTYCGVMSVLARRDPPLVQRRGVLGASVLLYVFLIGVCASAFLAAVNQANVIPMICGMALVLVFGVLLGIPYLGFLIGEYFDRARAAATGIDRMKVRPTYDQAAKAEHEKRFDEALALYRQGAAEHPTDPEPLRRMAEIHAARDEWVEAAARLKEAYPRIEEAEEKASLAFRAADLLARSGRAAEARECLESAARDLAGTPFEAYARERLKQLAQA